MTQTRGRAAERGLFLPGASGVATFWRPAMDALPLPPEKISFDYPGYGGNPPDPKRDSAAKLIDWLDEYIDRPVDIFAQSMGGAIGLRLALRRHALVRHLVLTGTTAGIQQLGFDAAGAREAYAKQKATGEDWLADERIDLATRAANLHVPCLLIFGSDDPIAPPTAGRGLQRLLPNAKLVEIKTKSHFFVREMADEVAAHIAAFLRD